MSVGFVMLVHRDFRRAAQVARHLAAAGAPVVVHVDARARGAGLTWFRTQMEALDGVRIAPGRTCDWGMWPIVEATVGATQELLRCFPQVRHVALLSGACLPLRTVEDLRAFLDDHPDTDFIESVATSEIKWTVGGLETERFSLWFPFSWKRQRKLFDAFVEVQRALRLGRRLPEGLVPHIGSQWWCLTRETLERIFADPRRPEWERYFRRTWIPDESFFQTLARRHARRLESRSLTFARFDTDGRPHVFYDDHAELLARSGHFFARKVWPGANRLYSKFLGQSEPVPHPTDTTLETQLAKACDIRRHGRPGLVMQGRFPTTGFETARPYTVIQGLDRVIEDAPRWLEQTLGQAGDKVHGRLFHPRRVEHAGDLPGGLVPSAGLRDYDPAAFLRNLLWGGSGRQSFVTAPGDAAGLWPMIAGDPNATIAIVTGAWIIDLWRRGGDLGEICREAARLERLERAQLALLPHRLPARIRVQSLSAFASDPMEMLRGVTAQGPTSVAEVPRLRSLEGLPAFIGRLRDAGYPLDLVGAFPATPAAIRVRSGGAATQAG